MIIFTMVALGKATGTAGLLELANAYAGLDQAPRRSVMFLAVTAEEQVCWVVLTKQTTPLNL